MAEGKRWDTNNTDCKTVAAGLWGDYNHLPPALKKAWDGAEWPGELEREEIETED